MRITEQKVRDAFQEAGVWDDNKLEIAARHANRIQDLANIKRGRDNKYSAAEQRAIGNLFGMVRNAVFSNPTTPEELHEANKATYDALLKLGVSGAKLASMAAASMDSLSFDANFHRTREKIAEVAALSWSWGTKAQEAVAAEGLQMTGVSWDDPNRVGTNSAWGQNIIDSGLDVHLTDAKTGKTEVFQMPMIRSPNLADVTADIGLDRFMIPVGNAQGKPTEMMSLQQALERPWELMHDPSKWPLKDAQGNNVGLYAPGVDNQARVSAQTSLLALSQNGLCTFKPTAYSYSSWEHEQDGVQPTVMTIMITGEGTSIQVLGKEEKDPNAPVGPMWWGGSSETKLYFNENGNRAPLTAESSGVAVGGGSGGGSGGAPALSADDASRIIYIQVPLVPEHANPPRPPMAFAAARSLGGSGVDRAVIGHGPIEGPYDENLGKGWKRDENCPVRATVQYAKTVKDAKRINWTALAKAVKAEIEATYDANNASRIGSLVMTGNTPGPFPWPINPPVVPFNGTGNP